MRPRMQQEKEGVLARAVLRAEAATRADAKPSSLSISNIALERAAAARAETSGAPAFAARRAY